MGDRVVLHVGAMKSGTSFLQSALMLNQDVLAGHRVRFLGGSFARQYRAVRDILVPAAATPTKHGRSRWEALADEARAYEGDTAVVSMEFLSFANADQVASFLAPFAGLDVHAVVTLRDQFRVIPAQWQTFTRNRGVDAWDAYLRCIAASGRHQRRSRAFRTFHRAQDLAPILERWAGRPEVTRLVVVTVPPPDAPREELWRRFCAAAGIPDGGADLGAARANPSLGYASCDYLRRVNAHLGDVPPRRYRKGIRPLSREALVHLRDQEDRPPLDVRAGELARRRNERLRFAIETHASQVVGSLDDLPVPSDLAALPREVRPPERSQVTRAAATAWDHCASRLGGDAGPRPTALGDLVEDSARLLRLVNGWRP